MFIYLLMDLEALQQQMLNFAVYILIPSSAEMQFKMFFKIYNVSEVKLFQNLFLFISQNLGIN